MSQASTSAPVSSAPPGRTVAVADPDIDALVSALYEVASISRRLTHDDPVESAAARVLACVRRLEAPRPSELAAELKLDLSTVSRHVRTLEASGHLAVRPDEHDGRAQRVVLTDAGHDAIAHVVRNRCEAVENAVSHWDPADRARLGTLLHRLAGDLARTPAATGGPAPTTKDQATA